MTNYEWLRTWQDALLFEYLTCGTAHCPPPTDMSIEYIEKHLWEEKDSNVCNQSCIDCWADWLEKKHIECNQKKEKNR